MINNLGFKINNINELDNINKNLLEELKNTKPEFNKNEFENICFKKIIGDEINNKEILIKGIDFEKMSNIDIAYFLNREVPFNEEFINKENKDSNKNIIKANSNKEENLIKNTNDNMIIENNNVTEKEESNYCICNKKEILPYEGNMISCDGKCKNWYHFYCIKMTKIEQNIIDSKKDIYWLCDKCLYN